MNVFNCVLYLIRLDRLIWIVCKHNVRHTAQHSEAPYIARMFKQWNRNRIPFSWSPPPPPPIPSSVSMRKSEWEASPVSMRKSEREASRRHTHTNLDAYVHIWLLWFFRCGCRFFSVPRKLNCMRKMARIQSAAAFSANDANIFMFRHQPQLKWSNFHIFRSTFFSSDSFESSHFSDGDGAIECIHI